MGEAALDRAQPHDHVGPRPHASSAAAASTGRPASRSPLPGNSFPAASATRFTSCSTGPHLAPFRLGQGLALVALAVQVRVVLRDGEHDGVGLGPHRLQDSLGADPDHVLVRAAELRIAVPPLAADQREILGVLAKYFSGGTSRAKVWTKNPSPKRTLPPCLASRRAELEFTRLPRAPIAVEAIADVRLAVLQDRHLLLVDRPDASCGLCGIRLTPGANQRQPR